MKAVLAKERQAAHFPEHYLVNGVMAANPERPERIERLLAGALRAGCEMAAPRDHGLGPIAAVHSPEYLRFLEHGHARWRRIAGASPAITPNIHPPRRDCGYPASVVAQAGYHMADASCPIVAETWSSALWSAWSAVEATEERPPRTQGEIVTDEDGSGANALVEFLASKKFI